MTRAEWRAADLQELRAKRGNRCEGCRRALRWFRARDGNMHPNLQFAHIKASGLCGSGRGQRNRYFDIKRNPECYRMLCGRCHRKLAPTFRRWSQIGRWTAHLQEEAL